VNRIIVPLDVPSSAQALALADTLRGEVGGFKVGKELFTAAGPDVVRALVAKGDRVFLDLKYHDIPNTVAGAVRSASELGVWMLNVHASGGRPMMEAARRAADEHGAKPGCTAPLVIAVTVLTSLDAATLASVGVAASPLDQVVMLARLAQAARLDGVVASPREKAAISKACIRGGAASSGPDDQQRTLTPREAVAAGSSYLVVGRPITGAADPAGAAAKILKEMEG
jgi:orotidine-5'-phosphate decarboxylase